MKSSRVTASIIFSLTLVSTSFSAFSQSSDPNFKHRMNKLFYWQLADELKLNPAREQKMSEVLDAFQVQREKSLKERDAILARMKDLGAQPEKKKSEEVLKNYEQVIQGLSKLDAQEYAELKKILGPETLTRFYVVREQILERLRVALVQNKDK